MKQIVELVSLSVILDSENNYNKGDFVYVNGAVLDRSVWAKEILNLDGTELILVPEAHIIIVKRGEKDDTVCPQKHPSSKGS